MRRRAKLASGFGTPPMANANAHIPNAQRSSSPQTQELALACELAEPLCEATALPTPRCVCWSRCRPLRRMPQPKLGPQCATPDADQDETLAPPTTARDDMTDGSPCPSPGRSRRNPQTLADHRESRAIGRPPLATAPLACNYKLPLRRIDAHFVYPMSDIEGHAFNM